MSPLNLSVSFFLLIAASISSAIHVMKEDRHDNLKALDASVNREHYLRHNVGVTDYCNKMRSAMTTSDWEVDTTTTPICPDQNCIGTSSSPLYSSSFWKVYDRKDADDFEVCHRDSKPCGEREGIDEEYTGARVHTYPKLLHKRPVGRGCSCSTDSDCSKYPRNPVCSNTITPDEILFRIAQFSWFLVQELALDLPSFGSITGITVVTQELPNLITVIKDFVENVKVGKEGADILLGNGEETENSKKNTWLTKAEKKIDDAYDEFKKNNPNVAKVDAKIRALNAAVENIKEKVKQKISAYVNKVVMSAKYEFAASDKRCGPKRLPGKPCSFNGSCKSDNCVSGRGLFWGTCN